MAKDAFTKTWITQNATDVLDEYPPGMLTLRGLYYQLVTRGMTNSLQHYKRVVSAMIAARWDGLVDFDAFSDRDRAMVGETRYEETDVAESIDKAKEAIVAWMEYYNKNKWENQPIYPEVLIEKKALQGVFESVCSDNRVALGACKGYPSLTFLNELAKRFIEAESRGKLPVILYFGDYDPSGEDIPRSIEENISRLGCPSIEVRRIALMEDQVRAWRLPAAPAKLTDSRTAKWTGIGQVELDAVEPRKLQSLCQQAIDTVFDRNLYAQLKETESHERVIYQDDLRTFVSTL